MTNEKAKTLGLLTGLSLVATTVPAHAAVISETVAFNASTSINGAFDNSAANGPVLFSDVDIDTVQFNQFDASLGTLTGVTYELFARVEESFMALDVTPNAAAGGAQGQADTTVSWFVSDLGGVQLAMTPQMYNAGCVNPGGGCSDNETVQMNLTESAGVAGPLGAYIGLGTIDVDVINELDLNVDLLEGQMADGRAVALGFGALTITYTFDDMAAVHTPGTVSLLALGLAGLLASRRRARRGHG